MKTLINQKTLLNVLNNAKLFTEKRSTLPVLSRVALDFKVYSLTLTATDLDCSLVETIDCAGLEYGFACVELSDLISAVKSMTATAEVSLSIIGDKFLIQQGALSVELQSIGREDFPHPSKVPDFVTPQNIDFTGLIDRVAFAASKDQTRPYINGVHFAANSGAVELVATDGHRLSLARGGQVNEFTPLGFTLNSKAVKALDKLNGGNALMYNYENEVYFVYYSRTLIFKKLEGKYPNYNQLIPQAPAFKAYFDTEALLKTLKQLAPLADKKSKQVLLSFNYDVVEIKAGGSSVALAVGFSSEPFKIAFNITYLLDAVKANTSAATRLEFSDKLRPALLTSSVSGVVGVIMPMRFDEPATEQAATVAAGA